MQNDKLKHKNPTDANNVLVTVRHGINCEKIIHSNKGGYLHSEQDDRPYDVDGVKYCGRCHKAL